MKKIFILFIMIANISTNGFAKDSYLNRGIGFGASIGNPIINLIMSFPFIDFEIGYGGSNGINLSGPKLESKFYDFNLLAIAALDFIFTISLIKNLNLGIGIGGNISISSHTSKLINVELGFGMRIPLVIFYDITENLEIGMKIAPSIEFISNTRSLAQHRTYSGIKSNFAGGIFAKYYIF
ncbi:DUF3996 domain-containing protein [Borreliella burgdorferi]|uniref:Outer membrane protein n=1 Tax=Borreliella burgdorferi (strain ZS7) TaxID=445985 RepID=A0A0H3C2S0_BORBZ|nr:DUF3996 domain-containing protein [Borreliella burgdorferi]AGS66563.1 hypothetical protein L144_02750 [Borreliella burgdorferi CA382]ACK74415.1 conserved hypothetical protein [Borreliella burgdorferi ZS7]EEH31810.1 conserved hypothetical protein [Borreliella burgdorferi Bol26]MCD2308669.1 DUF3996 domain-containing protein [Borreliella burgdorferi]MCD2317766.1 DUF3996 domain-containing protein [Borreliella burgdorferi]